MFGSRAVQNATYGVFSRTPWPKVPPDLHYLKLFIDHLFISAHLNGDLDTTACSLAARSVMLNKEWNKTRAICHD